MKSLIRRRRAGVDILKLVARRAEDRSALSTSTQLCTLLLEICGHLNFIRYLFCTIEVPLAWRTSTAAFKNKNSPRWGYRRFFAQWFIVFSRKLSHLFAPKKLGNQTIFEMFQRARIFAGAKSRTICRKYDRKQKFRRKMAPWARDFQTRRKIQKETNNFIIASLLLIEWVSEVSYYLRNISIYFG